MEILQEHGLEWANYHYSKIQVNSSNVTFNEHVVKGKWWTNVCAKLLKFTRTFMEFLSKLIFISFEWNYHLIFQTFSNINVYDIKCTKKQHLHTHIHVHIHISAVNLCRVIMILMLVWCNFDKKKHRTQFLADTTCT